MVRQERGHCLDRLGVRRCPTQTTRDVGVNRFSVGIPSDSAVSVRMCELRLDALRPRGLGPATIEGWWASGRGGGLWQFPFRGLVCLVYGLPPVLDSPLRAATRERREGAKLFFGGWPGNGGSRDRGIGQHSPRAISRCSAMASRASHSWRAISRPRPVRTLCIPEVRRRGSTLGARAGAVRRCSNSSTAMASALTTQGRRRVWSEVR